MSATRTTAPLVQQASGAAISEGWAWIHRALWLACGRGRGQGCILNVPETIIFEDGQPKKWIGTDESTGRVVRRDLGQRALKKTSRTEVGTTLVGTQLPIHFFQN